MNVKTPVVDELVEGAIDTQAYGSPSAFSRHYTDQEIARRAQRCGMRAIVTKNHHFETASRAKIVREETGFDLRGGITLNEWVGGLNPTAVDGVANFDADIVWMPSITAANHLEKADVGMFAAEEDGQAGITVLAEDGTLRDDALAVID